MKVISFSLWGNNPKYVIGAIRNAELARQIYPDWKCMFYFGRSVDRHSRFEILNKCEASSVIISTDGDWRMMFDRFRPIAEEDDVDVMISRDCDSRLSAREKKAVDEWLLSDKGFHIMRDHPYHSVPILGGMWGMKKGTVPHFKELMEAWPKEDRLQTDQEFLAQKIWPIVKDDAIIHDGFYSHVWGGIPFPTNRRDLEFVGEVFDENDKPNQDHKYALSQYLKGHGEPIRQLPEDLFE